jgi:hypothetical protein
MIDSEDAAGNEQRVGQFAWLSVTRLLSDVKRISIIFVIAAGAGLAIIVATSNVHGIAGTILQNVGTALFTAGLIAFPLAILGHNDLTSAARSDLRQVREASADKILEERLSKQHVETLREDTFGKPVIEHYRIHITLHEDSPSNTQPGITLVHDREYTAVNKSAATTLIDILHHTTGPLNARPSARTPGFIYACLDMDNGNDVLEWEPECDPTWTHSREGRSAKTWRGSGVSLGREAGMGNIFSLRAEGVRMSPGSTLRAKVISETQVAPTGAEPFVVFLPTIDLEVVVMCSRDMDVALFPLYAVQVGGLVPRTRVAARGNRMQEITWHWGKALFAGQGVILRWAKLDPEKKTDKPSNGDAP